VKVLLDENVPHQLRTRLIGHEVFTVQYLGWASLKNGTLLRTAQDADFHVFVTSDQNLTNQQNMRGRTLGIVVLSEQEWEYLDRNLGKIQSAIDNSVAESVQLILCE
jgi:predicted nuclease of predicted toxin-antitoxin system